MRVWELVRAAEQAQASIISKLEQRQQPCGQQPSEINEFMQCQFMDYCEAKTLQAADAAELVPESAHDSLQQQEPNYITFDFNGNKINLPLLEQNNLCTFQQILNKVKQGFHQQLSEKGITKIINQMKQHLDGKNESITEVSQITQTDTAKPSRRPTTEISTLNSSMAKSHTTLSKPSNKENLRAKKVGVEPPKFKKGGHAACIVQNFSKDTILRPIKNRLI